MGPDNRGEERVSAGVKAIGLVGNEECPVVEQCADRLKQLDAFAVNRLAVHSADPLAPDQLLDTLSSTPCGGLLQEARHTDVVEISK